MIRFDTKNGKIIDTGCDASLFCGDISVCYTLDSDDITRGKKPSATPYLDRTDALIPLDGALYGEQTRSTVRVSPILDGALIELDTKREDISELGLNLPFNFMGKLDGGEWKNQLLFNSPYTSPDKSIIYAFLTRPNGKNVLVAVLSESDGWKMDYSPYLWAHYFVNLKLLTNYDKAYGTHSRRRNLKIAILPVGDFDDCLEKLSALYGVPFIDSDISGGEIGEDVSIISHGRVDYLIEKSKNGERELAFSGKYTLRCEGEVELTPVCSGKRGAPITLYAYNSLETLYKKSMDSVDLDIIKNHTDGNLCEHQCWASAILRFLRKYKNLLSQGELCEYENKVKGFLDILTEDSVDMAVPRQTILKTPHDTFGAYNVFKSRRVQELFFGITILLDAYRYFGDEKYYEYALGATDCLLRDYQRADGRIEVDWGNGSREDYSSVCCPMIPIVDMANFLKGKDKARSTRYLESARALAEHLYRRGTFFPTEGGESAEAQTEMEEGSMSCTALALLYYCANVSREEKYIEKAKEILDIHDSWVIHTPICQMRASTLRWWETQWEGDADGPAICAGHAWTIWRAEANYLYYELTGDAGYLRKAKNGFLTNLSKIDTQGKSFSIYSPDEINGGGFHSCSDEVNFRIAPHFSDTEDCGISRYVWIRINDTFLK